MYNQVGNDRLYSGVVIDIINDKEYRVKYFEYPEEVSLPYSSFTKLHYETFQRQDVYEGEWPFTYSTVCSTDGYMRVVRTVW